MLLNKREMNKWYMSKKDFYQMCMLLGQATGCHQRPDRSFFFHGRQFPVCARCTGVFIGEILGVICFNILELSFAWILICILIMLADWGIQYITQRESTNLRRVVSGFLCGYAFGNLVIKVIKDSIGLLEALFS